VDNTRRVLMGKIKKRKKAFFIEQFVLMENYNDKFLQYDDAGPS
jgi:hypothetical protein